MSSPVDPVPDRLDSDPGQFLAELLNRRATETPLAAFLEDARSDRSISYAATATIVAELVARIDEAATGDAVLLSFTDPLSFVVTQFAVIVSGRRAAPVDAAHAATEIPRLSELLGNSVLVLSDSDVSLDLTVLSAAHSSSRVPALPVRGGGAALLFTSGTTGTPKGVELPERQLLFVAGQVAANNRMTAADRGFNSLPLFHVNAEVVAVLSTLVVGATVVLDDRFHRTGFWELLADRAVTWVNAVPAILAVLARGGDLRFPASVRFVRSASSPLPEPVRLALGDIPLVVSWGMTEGASQIAATPLGQNRPGSVGVPLGGEIQPRDAAGAPLPVGESGELWIRGPGIVSSYLNGAAPDRFDTEGWLRTGDLGRVDADGWVYLVGRVDDVINRGGEKVYPSEVEEVLLADPRVREAVVVARADEILGQVPVAYLIPVTPGAENELIEAARVACAERLPRFKRPVEIDVVSDLPRAATGKILRSQVAGLTA